MHDLPSIYYVGKSGLITARPVTQVVEVGVISAGSFACVIEYEDEDEDEIEIEMMKIFI